MKVSLADNVDAKGKMMHNLNELMKIFFILNKRVNYTSLPSKMLELHSPPLLC